MVSLTALPVFAADVTTEENSGATDSAWLWLTCNRTRKPGEFSRTATVALVELTLPDQTPPITGESDCPKSAETAARKTKTRFASFIRGISPTLFREMISASE